MTTNKFKLHDNFFISLREMLSEYATVGSGIMELVDETGKTIIQIDPHKHLSGCDLRGVDLSGLDLRDADLRDADLRDADLSDADLSDADLRYAVLSNADLSKAVLSNADLSNAQICSTNMYGVDVRGATLGALPSNLQIPRGKLIGFKKVVGRNGEPLIAKLMIKEGTPRSKATTNKMRAKSVVVLGFYEVTGERSKHTKAYSVYDPDFHYELGKINCDNWERNRWIECTGGIHFFLGWRDAVEYQM